MRNRNLERYLKNNIAKKLWKKSIEIFNFRK